LHFDEVFIKLLNCRHGRPCKTSRPYGGTNNASQIGSIHKEGNSWEDGEVDVSMWRGGMAWRL
jgi:hypothetical protein